MAGQQIQENVGSFIKTLHITTKLEGDNSPSIRLTHPTNISSYNWMNTGLEIQPTLVVPGNSRPTFVKNIV